MSTVEVPFERLDAKEYSFLILGAQWHHREVDTLIEGCISELLRNNAVAVNIHTERVPGAYELPVAAKVAAETGKYNAIICFGVVIRGETAHFEYVASPVAHGLQDVALSTGVPCIFGVLTTENQEQVEERLGGIHGHKGIEAAQAAVTMASLLRRLSMK